MSIQKIVISANFTIDPIRKSTAAFLSKISIDSEIVIAPYGQIFQQLLDPSSESRSNERGANAIFLRIEDLIDSRSSGFRFGGAEFERVEANAAELANCLRNAERMSVPCFLFLCPASDGRSDDAAARLERIGAQLTAGVADVPNLYVVPSDGLRNYLYETCHDPKANLLGHVPYTDEFFSVLGAELARKIAAHVRKPYKVIVADCDNTLWDGVCGEDGTEGVKFRGERIYLQSFLVEQIEQGMLVCLCSKNNEADAWDVFDRRSEMRLKREHVVAARINWNPKSENLKSLAEELQLGLDSFVFIDDDPAVCSEVRANCPDVFTLELPSDVSQLPRLLDHLWIFDRLKVTSEDKERTELYRREAARNEARSAATDIESFLESLELQCSISDMTPEQVPRVSQLSLRTNQFNSTTIRRSEAEIRAIVERSEKRILTVSVSDRFGDYGLVGSVVYELSGGSLEVDSFMLSCRVLGRGVEHEVLRRLAKIAGDAGATVINIAFDPTPKNIPFLNFLTEVAGDCKFDSRGRTEYRIPVAVAKSARPANLSAPQDREKRTQDHERSNDSGSRVRDTAYIDIAGLLSGPVAGWAIPGSPGAERGALSSEFIGARTDTELELAEIWARVLSVKDIGVRDDFFEMGGDSLSAVSMFVEIETTLGVSLPLSAIIGAPTIEKLARYIDAQCGGFGWKYVVPLQPEGTRTALFCMHAAGGNVLFYRDLAAELGPDQPVYGVQARGVADRSETAHDCVEEMAREYLVEIREAQPHGPYRLCGSSFGGLVAFEAARQLKAAGEEVAIVALFDTYAPGYLDAHQELRSGGRVSRILGRMRNMRKQIDSIATLGGKAAFVAGRLSKAKTQAKRKFLWKKNAFAVQYRKATGKELPLDLQRNQSAIRRALKSYRPHFYDGQIALFRASEQPVLDSPDPLLGWGEYAARVEDFEVVGSHGALSVYPFASDLAVKLAPLLTDVSKSSVRELSVAV